MGRLTSKTAAAAAALALAAGLALTNQAAGQSLGYVGRGSTVQGDILRGEGVALQGYGVGLYYSAMAGAINTDSYIKMSEYIYSYWQRDNAEKTAHRAAMNDKQKALFERNLNRPVNEGDLMRGDGLNKVAKELRGPMIGPSALKYYKVPLGGDVVRTLPFFYAPADTVMCWARLDPFSEDKENPLAHWPVGLRDPAFARERDRYKAALQKAIELMSQRKTTKEVVVQMESAIKDLADKLDLTINPDAKNKIYMTAHKFLKDLGKSAELLKVKTTEPIFNEIEKYSGTTVADLLLFMQRNNLIFAPAADIGDERTLYAELYAKLLQQQDLVKEGLQEDGAVRRAK